MQTEVQNKVKTAVILAGGRGTRMSDHPTPLPKPLIPIGGIPLIVHVMNLWKSYGVEKFVVATGYKHELFWAVPELQGKNVKLLYTGEDAQTATRLKNCLEYVNEEIFGVSYSDGVTSADLSLLYQEVYPASILITHPKGRFGIVEYDEETRLVEDFVEKPQMREWVNAGFFMFRKWELTRKYAMLAQNRNIYTDGTLEHDILPLYVGNMYAVPYDGFWQCADTPKEIATLESMWNKESGWNK